MKEVKFKKGIRHISFPIMPEIEGESIRTLRDFIKKYKLPKYMSIEFKRSISVKKGYEYDLTEIILNK